MGQNTQEPDLGDICKGIYPYIEMTLLKAIDRGL